MYENRLYQMNKELIERINSKQSSWTAGSNEVIEKSTIARLVRISGGKKSIRTALVNYNGSVLKIKF